MENNQITLNEMLEQLQELHDKVIIEKIRRKEALNLIFNHIYILKSENKKYLKKRKEKRKRKKVLSCVMQLIANEQIDSDKKSDSIAQMLEELKTRTDYELQVALREEAAVFTLDQAEE